MPTPLPLFTYPAAGDRNFPALGENALGTHNGLFYEGSVSTRRSGSAQQSAGWTSWNDPLRDCLWNVQPSAAPCQVLPASQRYVPPGLQPPKPSTSRGRVKRELTTADFCRDHPDMPFVPDALLSEGLKGVVPGMDDAASALAADYRGRCLEVMSRGEGGETLLFPSVDGHFMCMTHIKETGREALQRVNCGRLRIEQIAASTDTVAVRMAHYIKLMRLGSNENRPTSIATLSSFEGRLTDASFCKFASFEKNLVVATDANTVYTVDTTAGTSQRVIAPQRTLVSPRDIIRHVSYAHHPRIFLTCTHGAVALKDSRTPSGRTIALMEHSEDVFTNIATHPTDVHQYVFGSTRHISLGDIRCPGKPYLNWPHYEVLQPPTEFEILSGGESGRDVVVSWAPGSHRGAMVHLSQSHIQRPHCPLSGSSVPISASPIFTVPSIGGLTKLGYVPPLVPTFKQYRARYDTTPPLLDMAVRKTNVNGNGAIEWMSYHRLADGSLYTMPYRMSEFVSDSPSSTSLRRYACPKDVVPSVDNAVQPLSFEQRDVRAKLEAIESIKVNLLDDVAHITTLDETPAPSSLFRAAVLTDYEVAELDAECCPSACARVNIHGTPFAHIVEDAEAFHSVKPPTTYTRAASRDALADLLQARWGSVDLYGDRTVQPTTASVKQRRMDRSVQTADTPATMYPLVEALTTMSQPASTANSPVIIASVLPASQPVAGASSSREKLKSKKRVGFR